MKIRERLIVAFLIITAFPLFLMGVCSNIILSNQSTILENSYQTETTASSFIFNPLHVLYTMTKADYMDLVAIADTTPDDFTDQEYLREINHTLKARDSFIVVRKAGKDYFIGNKPCYQELDTLPGFSSYQSGSNDTISIDSSIPCLIKKKDFYFSDKSSGQIFLITNMTNLVPSWDRSIKKLILSLILVIIITATLLIIWLYNSIVKPLNILHIATMQIGAGHLDQPVHVNSTDEIGELCRDFEEMRIRLKEMIEERMRYEEDTRELISSMAHDLQTPLTSIKGYTEGILDGVANTPEKQQKYLRTIYSKASDMSYLVDELSVFAKVEQNSLPYHFLPINLHSYFCDCIEEFSLDLETKHINIHYDNQTSPDTMIVADPEQLKRVLHNIIGNSVKYLNKPNGDITISIRDVPVPKPVPPLYRQLNKDGSVIEPEEPPKPPQQYVEIKIHDNGSGIEAKDLPYIFQRFYRADASRNSSKRGSGLGLAIVARIIEDHEGHVWAQSTYGEGTSIFFTLKKTDPTERKDDYGKNTDS